MQVLTIEYEDESCLAQTDKNDDTNVVPKAPKMDLRTPGKFSKATALVQRGLILSEQCIGTYVKRGICCGSDLLFLVWGGG